MKKLVTLYCLLNLFVFVGCKKDKNTTTQTPVSNMYFPKVGDTTWERTDINSLGWNLSAVQPLKDYLRDKHSRSFMILVNGKIVMEEYFNGHTRDSIWEWNSAGKTLVSMTTGIAQQENLLSIDDLASKYLGLGWTSETSDKENLIKIHHLLSMSSGLNDSSNFVTKSKLTYMADAGTRWAYGNVFQKLMDVVSAASGMSYDDYFNQKIKNKIGMTGLWNYGLIFKIYHSDTRSMARFGLLALNKGKWENSTVVNESFFNKSIVSSQNINPSYGYLWWLNGKTKYMVPGSQVVFNGYLVPNAPAEMYAAMGASDQRIYIIPSKNMVIVRMGEASNPLKPTFAVSGFDDDLWAKINAVIN